MSPFVVSVTVFDPDDIEEVELSPQPFVPPTAIVPASLTEITTLGVESAVGVVTAVDSVAAAAVVSSVNAVSDRALAVLLSASVNVIVQV